MKAVRYTDKLEIVDNHPKPTLQNNESLIKITTVGICNTDLEIIKGYMGFKGVLGHEFVGIVEESSVKGLIGKRVVGEINCYCNDCDFCQEDLEKHCPNRQVLGIFNKDGCMAEYITLPNPQLYVVPDSVPDEIAVLTEPLAAACEIFTQLNPLMFRKAAILGSGKLGLLIAFVMHIQGGKPLLIGRSKNKLKIAKKWGINCTTIDDLKENNFDFIVEATGNPEGLKKAINLVKPRGTIILKSTYANNIEINMAPVVVNEIALLGSRCGPFGGALDIIEEHWKKLKPMITDIYPLDNAMKAFEKAESRESLKVLLKL